MARRYIYRYLILAIALPLTGRLFLFISRRLEQRAGAPTKTSNLLRKIGAFSQRRSNRALGKDAPDHAR